MKTRRDDARAKDTGPAGMSELSAGLRERGPSADPVWGEPEHVWPARTGENERPIGRALTNGRSIQEPSAVVGPLLAARPGNCPTPKGRFAELDAAKRHTEVMSQTGGELCGIRATK